MWPSERLPGNIAALNAPVAPAVTPSTFRKALDEARHTADPVHLVRVFGITESTAIYYVHTAHPGWQSVILR